MTARPGDPPEWATRCPWCQAPPGQRCTSPRGRRIQPASHDARIRAHATPPTDHERHSA
ncbi:zinc finger domain-containing protein [Streptomyces pharetrae]